MKRLLLSISLTLALSGCGKPYEKIVPFDLPKGWTHDFGCRYDNQSKCYSFATSENEKILVDVTIIKNERDDSKQYDLLRYTDEALKEEATTYGSTYKAARSKNGLICFYGKDFTDYGAGFESESFSVTCPDGKKTLSFFILSKSIGSLNAEIIVNHIAKTAKMPQRKKQ